MSEADSFNSGEFARLQARAERLAEEKSHLQLILHMMERLNTVAGLSGTIDSLLHLVLDCIGGTNLVLYYHVDNDLLRTDALGNRVRLDAIDDGLVQKVFDSRTPQEEQHDFSETMMTTPEFTHAVNLAYPLLVGDELVGVIQIDGICVPPTQWRPILPAFFRYAALVLKGEILGHTRLKQSHDQLLRTNKELAREIAERKRLEAEREEIQQRNQQLQKNESLGRMAGAIAHLFNNQLQAVMGNIELAIDDPYLTGNVLEQLNSAMQSARGAAEISKLMLIYVGQALGRHELVDLAELCRRKLPDLENLAPKNVGVVTEFPAPGPQVNVNVSQLQQILANLVTNAWEAVGTEKRGEVRVTVGTVAAEAVPTAHCFPVDWRPQPGTAYACLEVADSGCGIPAADIPKIFDPFFSSKFIGRGLGLSVALGFVRANNGGITVESTPGAGSRFRVFFSLQGEVPERPAVAAAEGATANGGGVVLLADDEDCVRRTTTAVLSRLGFTVLEAADGQQAAELFQTRKDDIRLAVLDLAMPRLDGWQVLAAIRALRPGLPVIMASGYDEAHAMAGEHAELPQVFLTKPYDRKGLLQAIHKALGDGQ